MHEGHHSSGSCIPALYRQLSNGLGSLVSTRELGSGMDIRATAVAHQCQGVASSSAGTSTLCPNIPGALSHDYHRQHGYPPLHQETGWNQEPPLDLASNSSVGNSAEVLNSAPGAVHTNSTQYQSRLSQQAEQVSHRMETRSTGGSTTHSGVEVDNRLVCLRRQSSNVEVCHLEVLQEQRVDGCIQSQLGRGETLCVPTLQDLAAGSGQNLQGKDICSGGGSQLAHPGLLHQTQKYASSTNEASTRSRKSTQVSSNSGHLDKCPNFF